MHKYSDICFKFKGWFNLIFAWGIAFVWHVLEVAIWQRVMAKGQQIAETGNRTPVLCMAFQCPTMCAILTLVLLEQKLKSYLLFSVPFCHFQILYNFKIYILL